MGTRQDSPRAGPHVCPSPAVAVGCAPWALKRRPRLRSGEHVPATRAAQRPHIWGAQGAGDQALPLPSRSRPGGPPVPDPSLLPGSGAAAVKCADQSVRAAAGKATAARSPSCGNREACTEGVDDSGAAPAADPRLARPLQGGSPGPRRRLLLTRTPRRAERHPGHRHRPEKHPARADGPHVTQGGDRGRGEGPPRLPWQRGPGSAATKQLRCPPHLWPSC